MAKAREIVTLMMTDVVGSTALWEAHPENASAAIAAHDRLIQKIVEKAGGQFLKHRGEGDATFSVFKTAPAAAKAAKELQEVLNRQKWPTNSPLLVRIALHVGQAESRDGDYFGVPVNRCARLRAITHGGQIILSESVFEKCTTGFAFKDHGYHRLKDLMAPERVYELCWSDRQFPPLASINALDHNLPVQLTAFVGRERELQDLHEALKGSRLVSLIGFGGAGKTRLALQAAAQLLEGPTLTVRFIALADLPKHSPIEPALARALGFTIQDAESALERISQDLRDREVLIFLDNCEHVVESAAKVSKVLLGSCPKLKILVTSRQPLSLSGERILNVGPLSVPDAGESHPVSVAKTEAGTLFVDRIRMRNASFALDAASAPLVTQLVRGLEGIPLAIEQAAARGATLGLSCVIENLGRKLELLSSKDRDLEPRQRTVRATIEWSYDLLDPLEKSTFAALGAFQDIFIQSDASEVCNSKSADILESLTKQSIVSPVHLSSHEVGYRLLDTVKEFARERLPIEAPEAYERHFKWCLKTANWIDGCIESTESAQAFHLLDRVYEDLAAGLRRAIESRNPEALNLAFALRKPWLRRGPTREGVTLLDRALTALPSKDEYLGADCHNALGAMAMTSGMNDLAKLHLEIAAHIFSELGHPTKVAATTTNLGILHSMKGDFEKGMPYFERAITAFRTAGDHAGAAKSALNLGRMLLDAGKPGDSVAFFEEALKFFESKDPLNEAISLINLAEAISLQDGSAQLQYLGRAFHILREAPDHAHLSVALSLLSRYAMSVGKLDDAAILLGAAEESLAEMRAESSTHLFDEWQDLEKQLRTMLAPDNWQRALSKGRSFDQVRRSTFAAELCDAFRQA